MIKGIVFDLDGVIVSTDRFHYEAWKAIADQEGIYFDEKINDRLRGVSRMASLDIMLERASRQYDEEEKLALATKKNEIYRGLLSRLSPSDVEEADREALEELRSRGYKLAVGSSSKNTPLILEKIGLGSFFDAVADGNQITHSKPNPEVFLLAAKLIGIDPSEGAVVEDAEAGIDAAKAGGFLAVGIGGAASYCRADRKIASLVDLLSIFKPIEKE